MTGAQNSDSHALSAAEKQAAWARQFTCPIHGAVPYAEITTKKTHLGCIDPVTGRESGLNRGRDPRDD